MKDISMQQDLVDYISTIDHVRRINRSDQVADILTGFNRLVSYVSVAIIALLLAVAVFLISNTVAIGISVRKEEIGIMRLIGAKNSFIKAPFLIEGVVIGLVGAAIPLAVLYYLYNRMIVYVAMKFEVLTSVMKFISVNELFHTLVPVGLALGVGIGLFGSIFTMQRHLKV
jgi:cell division transport system permease protein